jgi:uncharacterized protein
MDVLYICLVAFSASILTFFSGFGLGTLLTPVFWYFFPIDVAIALTGVVHFFNNLFKLVLVGKQANWQVVLRFGFPAVLAALVGALLLGQLTDLNALFSYSAFGREIAVYPIKLTIACLLILFATMDLIPYFQTLQFGPKWLPLGGILSGFFGGLSGNQGALRAAFLIKAGLSKEAFIGTAVIVSTFVDFTRLGIYTSRFTQTGLEENIVLVTCATLSAIAGSYLGNRLLKKITLQFLQVSVAILLIALSLALGSGLV